MGSVTVGLDIGTTSVKALAVTDDGEVAAATRCPHELLLGPGQLAHDADAAWRHGVLDALTEVGRGLDVQAVAVAAMVPSLTAVDAAGRPTTLGLLYGDSRGGSGIGSPAESGEAAGFHRWLAAEQPDARGFWPAQAVANHALCGLGAIDTATAMTAYPLFDGVGWDARLAAEAGASPDQLPALVRGTEAVGRVGDGLPAAGALVGGGTIDALAEQLVAGADEPGDVLVLCGTTLITWGVLPEVAEAPGLWTIPHTAAGLWLAGGPSNAGGLFLEAARRWLSLAAAAGVDAIAPQDLPVWLPYVRGERTPLHRRDLRASVDGLGLHHGPAHLLRAAYEASGFVVRHHVDLARDAGLAPRRIVATGGGTQVPAWMHALADTTDLPVHVAAVPEGAALGSAFIARCVAGEESAMTDARRWARTAEVVDPDPRWSAHAAERYERFRARTAAAASHAERSS